MQQRLDAAAALSATAHTIHTEEAAALQATKDEVRDLRTRLVEQQGLVAKVIEPSSPGSLDLPFVLLPTYLLKQCCHCKATLGIDNL